MMKKHQYEVPEAEIVKVKFEKNILSDPLDLNGSDGSSIENGTVNNQNKQDSIWGWFE